MPIDLLQRLALQRLRLADARRGKPALEDRDVAALQRRSVRLPRTGASRNDADVCAAESR